MATTHPNSPVAKRHARAGQWRTPAAIFPHPLTLELDGESVTIIVTKEKLSTRTRKKKYRYYLMVLTQRQQAEVFSGSKAAAERQRCFDFRSPHGKG